MLQGLVPLVDNVVCTQASEARSLAAPSSPSARAGRRRRGRRARRARPARRRRVWPATWPAGRGSVLVAGSLYLLADLADLLERGGAGSGGVY